MNRSQSHFAGCRYFALFACACSWWICNGVSSASEPETRWLTAAAIKTCENIKTSTPAVGGTGFFVDSKQSRYLVTASHLASQTDENSIVTYVALHRSQSSNSLGQIGMCENNHWHHSLTYDLSILRVSNIAEDVSLAASKIDSTLKLYPKSVIEVVGFPFGLGMNSPLISPVVVSGSVASEEMQSPFVTRIDRVHLCTPAIADGTSGGPVFSPTSGEDWGLSGVFIGNLADRSGAKLAKIAPAKGIWELIIETEKALINFDAPQD